MNFKKGDRVKFLNSVDEGVVTGVSGSRIEVEDQHGFIVEVAENELVKQEINRDKLLFLNDAALDQKVESDRTGSTKTPEIKFSEKKERRRKSAVLEIDLHINELIDTTAHLSNFQIVTIQMEHFRKMMKLAREGHYQKVIFIHGVGEGVLRWEIRAELREMPNCEYVDADFSKYGQGATEVNLRYN